MQENGRPRFDVLRSFGDAVDKSLGELSEAGKRKAEFAGAAVVGRALTSGELQMIEWMFGTSAGFSRARVFPRNYWWPIPVDRVMTPNGNIFYPGKRFYPDFSLLHVPVPDRALFMHEATHLYQWYVLRQWVMAKGLVDRQYAYELVPGHALKDYRVEQMGQIVQDYYNLRHGFAKTDGRRIRLQDYSDVLPVRTR